MKRFHQALFLLLPAVWMIAAFSASAQSSHDPADPAAANQAVPSAPHQNDPWKPPPGVTAALQSTADTLFAQGLADPRGCEYRSIEIAVGESARGGFEVKKTTGWVFSAAGSNQSFAVWWDGLVYPCLSVGAPADLSQVTLAALAVKPGAGFDGRRESMMGDVQTGRVLSRISACLLYRLGEVDLAQRVWLRSLENTDPHEDPYLAAAQDWLWALFNRAVAAHEDGYDHLALSDARRLAPAGRAVEAEAARRKIPRPYPGRPIPKVKPETLPYILFLDQANDLLADQERRARDAAPAPPAKTGKIQALIYDLQNVDERQFSQPGDVDLTTSSTVQALVAEGDAAVDPLLECLESDSRLTRSVHYWRDFFRDRTILGVQEPACVALSTILHKTFFTTRSTGDSLTAQGMADRKRLAAEIRAYWNQNRGVSVEERWYRTLADDRAGPEAWVEAARNIVRPADIPASPRPGPPDWKRPEDAVGEHHRLGGAILRTAHGAGVSNLLARRAIQVSSMKASSFLGPQPVSEAAALALCLAIWNPKAAAPALRTTLHAAMTVYGGKTHSWAAGPETIGPLAAKLADALAWDDPRALAEYATWIQTATPHVSLLQPLWRHPGSPAARNAVASLFGNPTSAWYRHYHATSFVDLIATPLLGMPGFQRCVVSELGDTAAIGRVRYQSQNMDISIGRDWKMGGGGGIGEEAPRSVEGRSLSVRRCDVAAWCISGIGGAPEYELYWPQARRDAALPSFVRFLRLYGNSLCYSPYVRLDDDHGGFHFSRESSDDSAWMKFARLQRPASTRDVREGSAIFSLAGVGPARPCSLPGFPAVARWTALRKYPHPDEEWDGKTGKPVKKIGYTQDVLVWQAEEALEGGHWRRYYGCVGPHEVARVPAEEIEFPGGFDWVDLPGHLQYHAAVSPMPAVLVQGMIPVLTAGQAVHVQIWLRNTAGVQQNVPTALLPGDPEHTATAAGYTMHAAALPISPAEINRPISEPTKPMDAPALRDTHLLPSTTRAPLAPGEKRLTAEFNMDQVFDLRKAGLYFFTLSAGDNHPMGNNRVPLAFFVVAANGSAPGEVRQGK